MFKTDLLIKLVIFVFFSALYQYFFCDAPSLFLSENDSLWYAEKSRLIFNGDWLGEYNRLTLVKNSFFSIFLSLIHFFKIKYTTLILCFHHFAVFFFVNTFRPKSILVFGLLLIFTFFYPEFFTVYKGTVIREDLEVILLLMFLGSIGRWFLYTDFQYCLAASLIAGIGLINRDSGFTWSIPFYVLLIYSLFYYVKNKKPISKIVISTFACIALLQAPSIIIKSLNNKYYGFYGKSLIYDSKFKALYGNLTSIRHKSDLPTVLGNPLSNQTISKIRKSAPANSDLKKLLDLLEGKWNIYKSPSTTPDVISGGKQWGVMLLWGLFYSTQDLYSLSKSAALFQSSCLKLIDEIESFCSLNKDFDCSVKNYGFIQNPSNWSSNSFISEIIFNFPKFFLKYFYWTLGEQQNSIALAPRNDDFGWVSGREKKKIAFDMLKTLNHSRESYEKERLGSSTLKSLQLFSYGIRYLTILIALFLLYRRFSNFDTRRNNFKYFASSLLIFCNANAIYYVYYLMLLKRGFKHLVITGSLVVPILIIMIHGLINLSEFDFNKVKKQ